MTPHLLLPTLMIASLFLPAAAQGQQAPLAPAATQPAVQRLPQNAPVAVPLHVTEEDVAGLEAGLSKVRAKLKADFENSAEWKAAVAAVKKTSKDYETARRSALTKVRATPEHAKAAAEHQKARQEYDALSAKSADEKTTEQLLQQVLTARSATEKLEAAALKNDPEVTAAKQASVKAQNDLAALRKRFEETYQSDPAWTAQIQQIDAAKKALDDDRRRQEQDLARQQQEATYLQRREQEDRAFRQEVLANMAVQRVLLEQQHVAVNQWYAAQPVYAGPSPTISRCLPHRTQYSYAPRVVYRERSFSSMSARVVGSGDARAAVNSAPPTLPPSAP